MPRKLEDSARVAESENDDDADNDDDNCHDTYDDGNEFGSTDSEAYGVEVDVHRDPDRMHYMAGPDVPGVRLY